MHEEPEQAVAHVRQEALRLLKKQVTVDELRASKTLARVDYSNRPPHVELVKKLHARDPHTAPRVGDRVSFVLVQSAPGAPTGAKYESPEYALEHNLQLDYDHYFEVALRPALTRLFTYALEPPSERNRRLALLGTPATSSALAARR